MLSRLFVCERGFARFVNVFCTAAVVLLCLSLVPVCFSGMGQEAYAAEAAEAPQPLQNSTEEPVRAKVQNTPAVVAKHMTVVGVEHVGADSPGTRLVFALKELCNTSSLFNLVADGKNRIQIVVHTAPEFPSRPEVGSVFSVAWLYQDKDGNLPYYLDQQTGVVTDQNAETLARQLAERTDRLGRIYEYLFR